MKNSFYLLFIILTISCFYSCFAGKGGYTDIKSSQWTLDSLNGNKIVLARAVTITFNEENGRISGYGGCNSYFGSYFTKDSNKVTFFEVGSTKMACDMLEIENEYFSSLKKADKFMITSKNLYLYSSGKLVIVFKENE